MAKRRKTKAHKKTTSKKSTAHVTALKHKLRSAGTELKKLGTSLCGAAK